MENIKIENIWERGFEDPDMLKVEKMCREKASSEIRIFRREISVYGRGFSHYNGDGKNFFKKGVFLCIPMKF